MRCSVVTLLHTPHSCMHTPPCLLPQPKPVPTEGGGGVGVALPEQDGRPVDEYQEPHEGVCVCVCACVCVCVCVCVSVCVCRVCVFV